MWVEHRPGSMQAQDDMWAEHRPVSGIIDERSVALLLAIDRDGRARSCPGLTVRRALALPAKIVVMSRSATHFLPTLCSSIVIIEVVTVK